MAAGGVGLHDTLQVGLGSSEYPKPTLLLMQVVRVAAVSSWLCEWATQFGVFWGLELVAHTLGTTKLRASEPVPHQKDCWSAPS